MKLSALLFTGTILLAQPTRFGTPACEGANRERVDRTYFVVCYDSFRKVAAWTAYELVPGRQHVARSAPHAFRHDTAVAGPIARNADYRLSGYSRGHLVPAEDMAWSEESLRATYVLSNAVPQLQSVNAGAWRRVENVVRQLAAYSERVYVFTGPIFADGGVETIGAGAVAVPTHTFKVVLAVAGGKRATYAAVVPNSDSTRGVPLSNFTTTVDEVQQLTGLDFFSGLPDDEEKRLEATGVPLRASARKRE